MDKKSFDIVLDEIRKVSSAYIFYTQCNFKNSLCLFWYILRFCKLFNVNFNVAVCPD